MKKFFTLLSLLIVMGISANVMAQSTGSAPYPGATHTYSVDGGGNGGTFTYTWRVLEADLTTSTDASISESQSGFTTDAAEVFISWDAGVQPAAIYYVEVKKEDENCSNTRLLKVTIAVNNFSLAIATTDGCYDAAVIIGKDTSEDPTYDHGSATVKYTVTPTGLSGTQGYTFTITPPTISGYSVTFVSVSVGTATGNDISVSDNSATEVTYTITKTDVTDNSDTNGTAANFAAQASISNGVSSLGSAGTVTGDKSATSNVSRPSLSIISTSEN